MAKYRLNHAQKEEIRRLTQLANRRIKAAQRAYEKEGKIVLPRDVVGHVQTKERWHTESTPLSRTVVFSSKKDYQEQLRFLRSFDPKAPGETKPGIREYTGVQREKTSLSVLSSLGGSAPASVLDKIEKLTAPQLTEFWRLFSEKASKLGVRYSSKQAMQETLNELFPEDMKQFENL